MFGFVKSLELGPKTSRTGLKRDIDRSREYQRQGAMDCYN